ncbi:hypothetical protein OR263_32580 [Streptomyces sp. NEAU-H22]|uniref:hypothetical protein n=1 Tax=Streptomyces sp. NEAU-H22 TaxID=2994655 RepID=UPI002255E064|nr:hypothetical protein [Streptomyces sp. NEAU-H22]MCX3291392.1 hypothetical protein [Streptomyces sp. NEAU-H22]
MTSTDATVCPHCGRPDAGEPFRVLSRHITATGLTVWTRCGCGSLQVRVADGRGTRVVSRGGPAPGPAPAPARPDTASCCRT